MMRVTNSMMVKRTKSNLNYNRSVVDRVNNQMSTQKKITKPSENPIIAIRSLRLRSTLSTITQYYENNIPDTESWMDVTETALTNMKDLITKAYEQVVYGTNDPLTSENRQTILKELKALQEQVYSEGNSDYAGRTVFTGYKTNQELAFTDSREAQEASYDIEERFTYKDVEKKKYYTGGFDDVSDDKLLGTDAPELFEEKELNRVRLSYAEIDDDAEGVKSANLEFAYETENGEKASIQMSGDGSSVTVNGVKVTVDNTTGAISISPDDIDALEAAGMKVEGDPDSGYTFTTEDGTVTKLTITNNGGTSTATFKSGTDDTIATITPKGILPSAGAGAGAATTYAAQVAIGDDPVAPSISFKISNTVELENEKYNIDDNTIVLDALSGELIFKDDVARALDAQKASFTFGYKKTGFEAGELHPENYFDCVKHTSTGDITYTNYDENGDWMVEGIFYNIAGGQEMQINLEGRDAFNSDIRRDMDDLTEVVQRVIEAEKTYNAIKEKIDSGAYDGEEHKKELEKLNNWLDAAKSQMDYYSQNMHDTYKSYITNFKDYLDDVDLTITEVGSRMSRVSLTKNRMSIQESTFKDLKSQNEDEDLSDLVINYTAASVAYQAALQAAAKIGNMTLLDYL